MVQINKYIFWTWLLITIVCVGLLVFSMINASKLEFDSARHEGVVQELNRQIFKKDSAIIIMKLSIDSISQPIIKTETVYIPLMDKKYENNKNILTIINSNTDSAIQFLARRLSKKDSN